MNGTARSAASPAADEGEERARTDRARAGAAPLARSGGARERSWGALLWSLPVFVQVIALVSLSLLGGNALSLWFNLDEVKRANVRVERTWTTIAAIREALRTVLDAETGQRGYILTGDAAFLGPYVRARVGLDQTLSSLEALLEGNPSQRDRMVVLRAQITEKFAELDGAIQERRRSGLAGAVMQVKTEHGLVLMEHIRELVGAMEREELALLAKRNDRSYVRYRVAVWMGLGIAAITAAVLALFYVLIGRNLKLRLAAEDALRQANENLENLVESRTQQLRLLSRHLMSISESEKAALASELHDELGSNLTAINLDVSAVAKRLEEESPALARRLQRALGTLHETVELKRRIIHSLRPSMLDSLGLAAALRAHCDEFARRTGVRCRTEIPEELGSLDAALAIAAFRVAQEALTNVSKYAQAEAVDLSLTREADGLRLRIVDDGVGIRDDEMSKPLSHGLLGMRERTEQLGGALSVRRGDHDRGTVVEAFLPIPAAS